MCPDKNTSDVYQELVAVSHALLDAYEELARLEAEAHGADLPSPATDAAATPPRADLGQVTR